MGIDRAVDSEGMFPLLNLPCHANRVTPDNLRAFGETDPTLVDAGFDTDGASDSCASHQCMQACMRSCESVAVRVPVS